MSYSGYYEPPDPPDDGPCPHDNVTDWETVGAGWQRDRSDLWVETYERSCLDCGRVWEDQSVEERVEVKDYGPVAAPLEPDDVTTLRYYGVAPDVEGVPV